MNDDHLVRRYAVVSLGPTKLRFIRRPVSIPPAADTMCFIDRGSANRADRYTVAKFKNGQWLDERGRPFTTPPLFWTEFDPDARNS